jgi:hypothetical protein
MFDPTNIQAILNEYDRQEKEMQRTLASLAQHGPKASYHAYKRACVKMMKQINVRRQLFQRMKDVE